MSGIFGYFGIKQPTHGKAIIGAMTSALPVHGAIVTRDWVDDTLSVGLGSRHPERIGGQHFAEDASQLVRCVMDGVVYEEANGREVSVQSGGATLLLDHYLKFGAEGLENLSGSFNVAWWDSRTNELTVATDKLGQRLLFYSYRNAAFAFGSALANLMATSVPSSEINLDGFSDLLNYGYILRERTLFESVQTLPPGGILRLRDGKLTVSQYWRLDSVDPSGRYDEDRLDEVEVAFKVAVQRALPEETVNAIGLTGGVDSRCIFSAAIHTRSPFITHTAGQPDSGDVLIAKKLSMLEGIPHIYESIEPDRIGEWLEPMVQHQGAMVATLDSHPCQHFDADFEFDSIVQGIGAAYAKGNEVKPDMFDIEDMDVIQNCLARSLMTPTAKRLSSGDIWRTEYEPESAKTPLREMKSMIDDQEIVGAPIFVVDAIHNRERVRKFLNKAIAVVRNCREAHFPFLDHQLVETLVRIPIADRVSNNILVDLMQRWNPRLLDVEYEKNLMPMSVSEPRRFAIRSSRAIRRRLAKRLKFVRPPRQRVANHSYVEWSRNEIKEDLTSLLYAPEAAFRKYLNWEPIERSLDEHFSGEKNWESLVSALVVFEIAHKLWVYPAPTEIKV